MYAAQIILRDDHVTKSVIVKKMWITWGDVDKMFAISPFLLRFVNLLTKKSKSVVARKMSDK